MKKIALAADKILKIIETNELENLFKEFLQTNLVPSSILFNDFIQYESISNSSLFEFTIQEYPKILFKNQKIPIILEIKKIYGNLSSINLLIESSCSILLKEPNLEGFHQRYNLNPKEEYHKIIFEIQSETIEYHKIHIFLTYNCKENHSTRYCYQIINFECIDYPKLNYFINNNSILLLTNDEILNIESNSIIFEQNNNQIIIKNIINNNENNLNNILIQRKLNNLILNSNLSFSNIFIDFLPLNIVNNLPNFIDFKFNLIILDNLNYLKLF